MTGTEIFMLWVVVATVACVWILGTASARQREILAVLYLHAEKQDKFLKNLATMEELDSVGIAARATLEQLRPRGES